MRARLTKLGAAVVALAALAVGGSALASAAHQNTKASPPHAATTTTQSQAGQGSQSAADIAEAPDTPAEAQSATDGDNVQQGDQSTADTGSAAEQSCNGVGRGERRPRRIRGFEPECRHAADGRALATSPHRMRRPRLPAGAAVRSGGSQTSSANLRPHEPHPHPGRRRRAPPRRLRRLEPVSHHRAGGRPVRRDGATGDLVRWRPRRPPGRGGGEGHRRHPRQPGLPHLPRPLRRLLDEVPGGLGAAGLRRPRCLPRQEQHRPDRRRQGQRADQGGRAGGRGGPPRRDRAAAGDAADDLRQPGV